MVAATELEPVTQNMSVVYFVDSSEASQIKLSKFTPHRKLGLNCIYFCSMLGINSYEHSNTNPENFLVSGTRGEARTRDLRLMSPAL